jgi:hypothetical protein
MTGLQDDVGFTACDLFRADESTSTVRQIRAVLFRPALFYTEMTRLALQNLCAVQAL